MAGINYVVEMDQETGDTFCIPDRKDRKVLEGIQGVQIIVVVQEENDILIVTEVVEVVLSILFNGKDIYEINFLVEVAGTNGEEIHAPKAYFVYQVEQIVFPKVLLLIVVLKTTKMEVIKESSKMGIDNQIGLHFMVGKSS